MTDWGPDAQTRLEDGVRDWLEFERAAIQDIDAALAELNQRAARIAELEKENEQLKAEAIELLTIAYNSGHREGWEPGPNTEETMTRIHDWLCNHDADPNLQKPSCQVVGCDLPRHDTSHFCATHRHEIGPPTA